MSLNSLGLLMCLFIAKQPWFFFKWVSCGLRRSFNMMSSHIKFGLVWFKQKTDTNNGLAKFSVGEFCSCRLLIKKAINITFFPSPGPEVWVVQGLEEKPMSTWKELQVIRGTWKLIVGYLNGPWNKPYSPIQTPHKFQNIL